MKNDKHGQIAVTFNWVYILIAGAVILLFFFGIVMKQKVSSEKTLTREVVDIMESIFTAAGVSEKTRNYIDMGGLRDEIFSFSCENAVSNFGMGEYNKENGIEPIFSPSEIRSRRLILWSLPYKLPFKVTDLLFVSSSDIKYSLIGPVDKESFGKEFINATEDNDPSLQINREWVDDIGDIEQGNYYQLRIVDLLGNKIVKNADIPNNLISFQAEKISAVSFSPGNVIQYYEVIDNKWQEGDGGEYISIGGERDAAKYAAIFAENYAMYKCNMQKVFKRLNHLTEIYLNKLEDIKNHYGGPAESCYGEIVASSGAEPTLANFKLKVESCDKLYFCDDLRIEAIKLREANNLLNLNECIRLY